MDRPAGDNPTNGSMKPASQSRQKQGSTRRLRRPGKNAATAPLGAAKGDDDLMSQEQPAPAPDPDAPTAVIEVTMPSVDEINDKWKREVRDAGVAWSRLTREDLLKLEGHEQTLTGLVQERYGLSRGEADQQVKSFLEKSQSSAG